MARRYPSTDARPGVGGYGALVSDEPIGLLEGLATTRAIRRFRPDPIPDDDLATILWHASRAPTGSNRQSFRFLVLRDGPNARQAKAAAR